MDIHCGTPEERILLPSILPNSVMQGSFTLNLIDDDELISFALLDRYPLFQYPDSNGNLNLLFLGSGIFVKRMILSALSCGQMIGRSLIFHIISSQTKDAFVREIEEIAPELGKYSNLYGNEPENLYVRFDYHCRDISADLKTAEDIVVDFLDCRYVLISLGADDMNMRMAELYAEGLEVFNEHGTPAVILYYLSKSNEREEKHGSVLMSSFGSKDERYRQVSEKLGMRTLKLAYLYDKLARPTASLHETMQKLADDKYSQHSSCSAALHLPYKLASAGITPSSDSNTEDVCINYQKALKVDYGRHLALEHRRWMCQMIADGYTLPDMREIAKYSFKKGKDGIFNNSFKDLTRKKHPCLVPCRDDGIALSRQPERWDCYSKYEEIDATNYDDLDKMSLKLHLLARTKITQNEEREGPAALLEKEIRPLLGHLTAEETCVGDAESSEALRELLARLHRRCDELSSAFQALSFGEDASVAQQKLSLLEELFAEAGISASERFARLKDSLEIYIEYSKYRDYKAPDSVIIDNLPWILFAEHLPTVIKLASVRVADNIAGPLILEPGHLLFFGPKCDENFSRFLRLHGIEGQIGFVESRAVDMNDALQELSSLCESVSGKCFIDITGAEEQYVTAASILAYNNPKVGLLRSGEADGTVQNLMGCQLAPAYHLKTKLTAGDVFSLYGAEEKSGSNNYMQRVYQFADSMWDFYLSYRDDWEALSAFFAIKGRSKDELRIENVCIGPGTEWISFSERCDTVMLHQTRTLSFLQKMEQEGLLRDLSFQQQAKQTVVCFAYPKDTGTDVDQDIGTRFANYLTRNLWIGSPFHCILNRSQLKNGDAVYSVRISSGCKVWGRGDGNAFEDRRGDRLKKFSYSLVTPALSDLSKRNLIRSLSLRDYGDSYSYQYCFAEPAIQDCLIVSGNVLELHAWKEAVQTGYFDDCKANFAFRWRENVANELDLILVKGLVTLVISCKTAKFKKDHLYEIKYLTDRFSLNSKAVIIYSSTQAIDEKGHISDDIDVVRQRAKAMNVHLLEVGQMRPGELGQALIAIAES